MGHDDVDERIARLLAENDTAGATEAFLAAYGTCIFQMMMGVLQDEATVQDLYQQFSVRLWESLDGFRGESKAYTWAYTIARRTVGQHLRGKKDRLTRLNTGQQNDLAARWTRTATAEWRKTESRDRFREMCEDLDHDERTLVMLRIGEEMTWKEIARVMHDGDEPLDEAGLSKESARLRKQFQRVKDHLKRQAR